MEHPARPQLGGQQGKEERPNQPPARWGVGGASHALKRAREQVTSVYGVYFVVYFGIFFVGVFCFTILDVFGVFQR